MQSARQDFWKGFWGALPFCFVVGPYGMVFGVLAYESGLDVLTAIAFSFAVIAGAAQFTALSLMQDQAPTVIIIVVGLAVNLRMALYSATLAPYLGAAPFWVRALVAYSTLDHSFALADAKYRSDPSMTLPQKLAFFFWRNRASRSYMDRWDWSWRLVRNSDPRLASLGLRNANCLYSFGYSRLAHGATGGSSFHSCSIVTSFRCLALWTRSDHGSVYSFASGSGT